MRVTKAIREYVEEEIRKKYDEKTKDIGKEYQEEKKLINDHLNEILAEANDKAMQYIESVGYHYSSYRGDFPFTRYGEATKPAVQEAIGDERRAWETKCNAKIKEVIFNLEMGETAKAELKDLLDNMVVD